VSLSERLREALAARGADWPAPLHHLETVGSTNDWLKEAARAASLPEWSAVVSERQTAGRGRQGHTWVSLPGNLFLSVLLRPRLTGDGALALPLLAGVAVAEAAEEMGADVRLKWPNDVVAGGAKLGGILAEGFAAGAGLEGLVIGIGLNLAVEQDQLPEGLGQPVTSIRGLSGRTPSLVDAAAAVLARMRGWYDALSARGAAPVLDAWRARSLPWWGRTVEARAGGAVVRGIARGIDGRGALLLDLEDGRRAALVAGEVREVRPT
jgi:BirA family biotin operon repressor/biotin-[acetyl-CoA-carboxylase] ligase